MPNIPIPVFLIIVGFSGLLLATISLLQRRKRAAALQSATPAPRFITRILRLAGFALISFVLIGLAVMVYIDYRQVKQETTPAPSEVSVPDDLPFEVEEVHFKGGDGIELAGWFVAAQNGATVILLHGYGSNRLGMRWHAERLVEAGYGVLMYDERASGESGGSRRSYGWEDAPDVGGALAYLSSRPEVDPERIAIAGCSIGGQIALQGAASYLQIAAVWADGPSIIRQRDMFPPFNWATTLAYISGLIIDRMYVAKLGINPPGIVELLPTIEPRPVMLVGGGVPHPYFGSESREMLHFAQYSGPHTRVWIIDEAYHCDGPAWRAEEYATRMLEFFGATIGSSALR